MSRRQMFPVFLRRNIFTVDSIRLKHYPDGGEIEFLLCRKNIPLVIQVYFQAIFRTIGVLFPGVVGDHQAQFTGH